MDRATLPRRAKERPRWTIELQAVDRFEFELYDEMVVWLEQNMSGYRVRYLMNGGRAIKAVTFSNHDNAMLFYLRFVR